MGLHAPFAVSRLLSNAFKSSAKSAVKIGTMIRALGTESRNLRELMNRMGFRNGPCGVKSRVSTSPINGAQRERAFHKAP